jgi:hypothetical protein
LASGPIKATGAFALVARHDVQALSAIFARIVQALVNVGLAITPSVAGFTLALVSVDSIHTFSIDARIVNAIIVVMLAILAPRAWQASAFVAIGPVDTNAPVLTGIGQALIDGSVAQIAAVAGMTLALERVEPANAVAVDAGIVLELALVVVDLAAVTRVARAAVADEGVVGVATAAAVHARIVVAIASGDHFLASLPGISDGASAPKAVDEIRANASILARIGSTFVNVRLAMSSTESRHANAAKSTSFVNAGPLVLTRVGFALVHVGLTAASLETREAVTAI